MKIKRATALLLMLCLIFALFAACGTSTDDDKSVSSGSGNSGEPAAKDALNVAVNSDSGTLDHMGITGSGGFLVVVKLYMEPLMHYDEDANAIWVLATGMDKVSDIEYTMHLREDIQFSNGNDFTAEDVMFTMEQEAAHANRFLDVQYVDFEKTSIVDDHTIDLWFTAYTPVNFIKMSQMLIMDAESYDVVQQSQNPVGTGAYKVTDYVVNSHVYLERRDDYWGDTPYFKYVNFKCLNEQSQVTNALETGEIDYASIPAADAEYIESLGKYDVHPGFAGYAMTAYYNQTPGGLLGTKAARDAISYAWDAEAINDAVYYGYAEYVRWPLSEHLIDFDESYANADDTYADRHNLEKAKAKAEEAGLIGKTIRVITNGTAESITVVEILQADLATIGVTVDIINYDQATYYSMLMDVSTYDVAIYGVSAPSMLALDMFANYPTFFTCGWPDEERLAYVQLGLDALGEPDDAKRTEMLKNIINEFYAQAPWYSFIDRVTLSAFNKGIKGVKTYLDGSVNYVDWSF
jgi:peptide/nickel transport system substrate-binding protein